MPDRTEIISAASHIEAALRDVYQAEGRMFGEMITELHGRAPKHIIDALREVSAMRNEYAHLSDIELERLQSAPRFFERRANFFRLVDLIDRHLKSVEVAKREASRPSKTHFNSDLSVKISTSEEVMFSEWIIHQPITSMPILIRKPLHRDCFVVFTNKGAPHSVAPVSQGFVVAQTASFFCDGAVGIAKDITFTGEINSGLVSADGVPVRTGFHLKFQTDSSRDENLLEIARESDKILSELEKSIIAELRRYISSTDFDDLTDHNRLDSHEANIFNKIKGIAFGVRVLRLERMILTELQSGNPIVKSQAQMGFERRRRQTEEEEVERQRNIQIAQDQQMREIAQDARLSDAKIDAVILETRAVAMRNAGEYSLSQEQIFELFRDNIRRDIAGINAAARIEVSKQSKGEWVALGAMRMLDKMSLGDSRVRVFQEQDFVNRDEDPDDDQGGF